MDQSLVTCPTRVNPTTVSVCGRRCCYGAYFRPTAGDFVGFGGGHGLHRGGDDQCGLDHHDVAQHRVQVGFYGQVDHLCAVTTGPVFAPPDLASGFFAGDIQRTSAGLRPVVGNLE